MATDDVPTVQSLWIWGPLCVAFVAPFVDLRRPGRVLHLDLLVLLAFGGYPLIGSGSAVLAYLALAYVLVRLLWVAARPGASGEPLIPHLPMWVLAVGLLLLVSARIAVNLHEDYVIDTGLSGLAVAERIADGEDIYRSGPHHDTYGPVNYLAYLPFALAFGEQAGGPDLAAARAAATVFDLFAIGALFLLGVRLFGGHAGKRFGLVLAYAWAAYPYTLHVLAFNTNDALLAALLILALASLASPVRRGGALALGAAAKFAALPLVPLFATVPGHRLRRPSPTFALAFVAVIVTAFGLFLPDGGVREVYERTLGFQMGGETMYGVWAMRPPAVQIPLQLAAFALACAVAFLPRRREAVQVAALAGAVLAAVQLAAQHWSYFYVVWLAPFAFAALFGGYGVTTGERDPGREPPLSNATSTNGTAQGRYAHVQ